MNLKYRPEIDGLRAVAVLPVVLFHAGVPFVSGGYVGVDVFFVISGFLITSIIIGDIDGGGFSIVRFYERRIRRILPALFAVVAVTLAVSMRVFLPDDLGKLSGSVIATATFASNILFLHEVDYFNDDHVDALLHTWSLAVEEQYYIFFPLLLLLLTRLGARARVPAALYAVALVSFALNLWWVKTGNDGQAFYLTPSRAWELMLGGLLAVGAVPVIGARIPREIASVVGLGLIAWSVFAFTSHTSFPGWRALLPSFGAALIIHSTAGGSTLVGRLLATRIFVFVGLISYSLYLVHWPIVVFTRYLHPHGLELADIAGIVAGSLAAAVFCWHYVEKPFRRRNGVFAARNLFVAAVAAIVIFGLAGAAGVLAKGWPSRLPNNIAPLAARKALINPDRGKCILSTNQLKNFSSDGFGLERACGIGDARAIGTRFLLWGDSHAEAIRGGLDKLSRMRGERGYLISSTGCPPLIDVERYVLDQPRNCQPFAERALQIALDPDNQIDRVILSARWPFYEGGGTGADADIPVSLKGFSTTKSPDVVEKGLRETIRRLQAAGMKVFLVGSIPEPGFPVSRAVLLHRWLIGEDGYPGIPVEVVQERSERFEQLSKRLAAELNVEILDPASLLCGQAYCIVEYQGKPLYFDDDHLSRDGADFVAQIFEPVFRKGPSAP